MTLTLELDFAFDTDIDAGLDDALMSATEPFDSITYRIVTLHGPAGGWPVVRFVGNVVDMLEFVVAYCGGDREQAAELLEAS